MLLCDDNSLFNSMTAVRSDDESVHTILGPKATQRNEWQLFWVACDPAANPFQDSSWAAGDGQLNCWICQEIWSEHTVLYVRGRLQHVAIVTQERSQGVISIIRFVLLAGINFTVSELCHEYVIIHIYTTQRFRRFVLMLQWNPIFTRYRFHCSAREEKEMKLCLLALT